MIRTRWMTMGALILSLLLASGTLAVGSASLDWWVMGSGGGSMTAGNMSLDGTIGQWLVGSDENGNLQLGPGFWGGGWDQGYVIFLPVILKGIP